MAEKNGAGHSGTSSSGGVQTKNSNTMTAEQIAEIMQFMWRFMPGAPTGAANKWADNGFAFTSSVSATSPFEKQWELNMYDQSPNLQGFMAGFCGSGGCQLPYFNGNVQVFPTSFESALSGVLEPSSYVSFGSADPSQNLQINPNYTASKTMSPALLAPGSQPAAKITLPASPPYQKQPLPYCALNHQMCD
jgi:hypothetical protein